MRICVLQPSYAGSSCDYQRYDPPRDLAPLLPEHEFHHEFLEKATAFGQIKALQRHGFDIFVNLCEGYRDSDVPSIDVIHALEDLNLPFTGPTSRLYDPSKDLMKLVALSSGVTVPAWQLVGPGDDGRRRPRTGCGIPCSSSRPPTATAWASTSTRSSRRPTNCEHQVAAKLPEFGRLLVEEYIDGRELTVLVMASPDHARPPLAFTPIEFLFPPGPHFKTYDLKVTQFHPECNVPCTDADLAARLKAAAIQVFDGFHRRGLRQDGLPRGRRRAGSSSSKPTSPARSSTRKGYQGSADYILAFDGIGQSGSSAPSSTRARAPRAPAAAVRGQAERRRLRHVRGPRPARGSVVFEGEGRAQRIVTRSHVDRTWSADDRDVFYRYAYPISSEVFVLWDTEPTGWAPQNHSCDPNTEFVGLNLVARRDIRGGEELTVDYATFYDRHMTPFDCACGSPQLPGPGGGREGAVRG